MLTKASHMNTLLSNNDYVIPEAIPGVPDLQASLGASPPTLPGPP